jgi:hypothetical protein
MDSLTTAWKYGRESASWYVIGQETEPVFSAERISETRGFVMIWRMVARIVAVVESDPASLVIVGLCPKS